MCTRQPAIVRSPMSIFVSTLLKLNDQEINVQRLPLLVVAILHFPPKRYVTVFMPCVPKVSLSDVSIENV